MDLFVDEIKDNVDVLYLAILFLEVSFNFQVLLSISERSEPILGTCSLREKCPYSELFWSAFSRIQTEYGEILRIFFFHLNDGGRVFTNEYVVADF